MHPASEAWQGSLNLSFQPLASGRTVFQGGGTAPLKVQRSFARADGRCELPILHTAGGLVGGDRLSLRFDLAPGSRALLTSVAAQKVYGSIGRSRRAPAGSWARQELEARLGPGADLEWLPQELVLFADGLFEQRTRVWLAPGASWLGAEVVRLGRTAAGEALAAGRWRSDLEIRRLTAGNRPGAWELVDRLELGGDALAGEHGLAGRPVFGSLVWAAPLATEPLAADALAKLLELCRADRAGLEGEMACGALPCGMVARYRGDSTRDARLWFARLWVRIRALRCLAPPQLPRVWPFQEDLEGSSTAKAGGHGPP
jgi:urease accessory protein